MAIRDWQDFYLDWRQPERKRAGILLSEQPDHALQRSERSSVNHYRTMRLAVFADVFEFKPLRQVVIHLHGSHLPLATKGVLDHQVELRAIKRGVTRRDLVVQPHLLAG